MKFLYNLRVKIKGDHLRYSADVRCEPCDYNVEVNKLCDRVCKMHKCDLPDITIEYVGKSERATKLMGGK